MRNLARYSSWYMHRLSRIVFPRLPSPLLRLIGIEKPLLCYYVSPFTMVPGKRLRNTYDLARRCVETGIRGAFVECGVWRGGCAAILAYVAHTRDRSRPIHLFDSFEGLPQPIPADGPRGPQFAHRLVAGKEEVQHLLFDLLRLDQNKISIHQGWFDETVPRLCEAIGPIALLRLDGDFYESTKTCLEHLYGNVVPGGFVIIDDYAAWPGCQAAVDEFLAAQSQPIRLVPIDQDGCFFVKPAEASATLR